MAEADTTEALAVYLANEHLEVLDTIEQMADIDTDVIAQAALDMIAARRGQSRTSLRALQRAAWKALL